ncbi:MAG: TRAP transporter substrate-binding protein DctP [Chitinophagales bacterium]|nr:TRAP transporter substrate-binding protein DctP [Chitinophagales bacterium]
MKNSILFFLLFTFSGFMLNAQCNWVNGADPSLADDNGRGITDWTAHYQYAINAADLTPSVAYIGNRMTTLENCLPLETYAAVCASISVTIAKCGIEYANWTNSPDNAIPGCGILDSADHYSYAIGGNNNSDDLTRQKFKYLSENIDKEVYAKLYADVSVALAKAGTTPVAIATPTVSTPPPAPVEVVMPVAAPEPFNKTIKIATLFPKSSSWGKILETWVRAVNEKSNGNLELQIFYNGVQGDEAAVVGKMKSGQLDAAVISSVGLSKIYKPILALQMPGLFKDWLAFDKARDAMRPEFEKGVKDAGFSTIGWYDIGKIRMFAKGFSVKSPGNIKGKKPVAFRNDDIQSTFFQTLGGVVSVPLNVPEVLPALNTGSVNFVFTSALFAEQMQWPAKMDNISNDADAFAIGSIVISSKRLDGMPADLKAILLETGKLAASSMQKKIRIDDDMAFMRLKSKMSLSMRTTTEQAEWKTLYKQVRTKLSQGTFTPELVTKIEQLAGQ